MSQQIEIEFKTMLTKIEFKQLLNSLSFTERPVVQTNHYFETEQFDLKKHRTALRIREKENTYILTLKEPHEKGILETNDYISATVAKRWLQGNPIPQKNVSIQLDNLQISETKLRYFGA